ncbi:MAG TPA: DUF5916 domain-containing protein [Vicinamibacterales bacterium]|nr:DUF5916 domain-containing protein [Vicinamibacterales bacterium]
MPTAFPVRRCVVAILCCSAFLVRPATAFSQTPASPDVPAELFGPPPPVPPEMSVRDAEGRLTMRAVRIDVPLTIDGRLDEAIYSTVPPVSGFVQQEPHEGQPATEDTDLWVFFDDRNLYIAGRMWDSHPERIQANELRRDNRNIGQNDSFSVSLDTFYDRRSGYYFQTNSIGGVREALVADERSGNNFDWNTVWDTHSAVFEQGWATEMVIPFKSLRYRQRGDQVWSINVRRVVRWRNETSYLSPVPASYGGPGATRFNVAATLVGVEVPATSRNLELKPYAISELLTNRLSTPAVSNHLTGDVGFDAKYGLTRSLTFDFTYNTDFAQVEEDEQQVNLTRFSQFFPERRDFFLEGQGLFEFASVRTRGGGGGGGGGGEGGQAAPNETPLVFFSRRIGLQNGVPTPIRAGSRLTGRVGQYSVGLLNIQTGDEARANAVATNFSVVRLRRDVLRRSTIGVIATNRSPTAAGIGSNQVGGVDANFGFYENLNIGGYYAATRSDDRHGDTGSYRGQFDYAADRYGLNYEYLKVGEDFNPEIGFLRRQNFRRNFVQLRFSPRPRRLRSIRKLYFETNLDYIVNNTDGRLQSRLAQGTFKGDLQSGDQFEVNYNRNFEALPQPFEIAREVILPTGDYAFNEIDALYRLGPQRRLTGDLRVIRGGFYSGRRTEVSYAGRIEVTPRLSVEPRLSVNSAQLPQGDFVTKLLTTRATFTVTPRMFASGLVQYNSSTSSFSTNVRLRWEYRPGSDLFVVYTEGRTTTPTVFDSLQSRGVVVKYTQLFRL